MQAKIKIIKKAKVEGRTDAEEQERIRRIEINMLQILSLRYPEQARQFIKLLP
jgi:hypothetical protein